MAYAASQRRRSSPKWASSLYLFAHETPLQRAEKAAWGNWGRGGSFTLSPELPGPQRAWLPSVPSAQAPPAPARSPPPSAQVGRPRAQPSPPCPCTGGGRAGGGPSSLSKAGGLACKWAWSRDGVCPGTGTCDRRRPGRARLAAGHPSCSRPSECIPFRVFRAAP